MKLDKITFSEIKKSLVGLKRHYLYKSNERKVFVIGLSRTGTLTITKALSILGFQSAHYPSISFIGNKPLCLLGNVLKEKDAITDISTIPFYKHYASRFPNACFILTIREREAWLNSLMKKPNINEKFSNTPWKNKLRKFVYGSDTFDYQLYQHAYDYHVNSVKQFFENKQERLLLINIPGGEGWDKLCTFLNCPAPNEPFPFENKGYKNLIK